jgi:hypothetical protein
LEEFARRIDGFMDAMLAREALPYRNCSHCTERLARWRCQDCSLPTMLCRLCMRSAHQHDPLHRIECWNGKYFRSAALWEVGVHILVKHYAAEAICSTLKFNIDNLGDIQIRNDNLDQDRCRTIHDGAVVEEELYSAHENAMIIDEEDEDTDASFINNIPGMSTAYTSSSTTATRTATATAKGKAAQKNPIIIDESEDEETDAGFINNIPGMSTAYTSSRTTATATATAKGKAAAMATTMATATANITATLTTEASHHRNEGPQNIPTGDALNNRYLRIVHINGIHHLAVVSCTCKGEHQLPIDFVHSGFIPSTFLKIRTVFTTKVLDIFRLSNLELKASAYQYFQLLQRLTEKAAVPSPNLYNDLRKVSRAWRWMKKLKWAGYGHKVADPMLPAAGEMSIFCPACPQPNVNLPSDWKNDPNRYVKFTIVYKYKYKNRLMIASDGYFAAFL